MDCREPKAGQAIHWDSKSNVMHSAWHYTDTIDKVSLDNHLSQLGTTGSPTVPLDLNFTHARAQKATARNIHGNAPE